MTRRSFAPLMAFVLVGAIATPTRVAGGSDHAPPPVIESATSGGTASPEAIAAAAAERATYGLPADFATVAALLGSNRDVGTARWGIALTAEEEATLDLPGRMAFVEDVDRNLLQYARSLDTFAGAWIDQADGSIVLMLTEVTPSVQSALVSRLPAESRGMQFVRARYSLAVLRRALSTVREAWEQLDGPRLLSVYVDEQRNRLVVNVLQADQQRAQVLVDQIAINIEVPVALIAEATNPPADVACTDRSNCSDPYKAGTSDPRRIHHW